MNTYTEENYMKVIYHLSEGQGVLVNTSTIASSLSTTSASVTDMIKRLAEKNLVDYEKYKGVKVTSKGEKVALKIIRKHRLWELFLTKVLKFKWDEVHLMAEELEHASSDVLIDRMDEYLGFPTNDPHGDPIPDSLGKLQSVSQLSLVDCLVAENMVIVGVTDHSASFLQYLERVGLMPGKKIKIIEIQEYDKSMMLEIESLSTIYVSADVSKNIRVQLNES
jgi:DtxR family Mn-dependent transcriptional regulator